VEVKSGEPVRFCCLKNVTPEYINSAIPSSANQARPSYDNTRISSQGPELTLLYGKAKSCGKIPMTVEMVPKIIEKNETLLMITPPLFHILSQFSIIISNNRKNRQK
jgi:hypothetical protein